MAKERKYKVGCSGSGWGIWEIAIGRKIEGFGQRRPQGRAINITLFVQPHIKVSTVAVCMWVVWRERV